MGKLNKLVGEIDGLLEWVESEGVEKDKIVSCLRNISKLAHGVADAKQKKEGGQ